MINALSVAVEENLQPLSRYLWTKNIAHRISEQAGQQVIWAATETDVELVQDAYRNYQQGQLPEAEVREAQGARENVQQEQAEDSHVVLDKLRAVPCVSLLIAISILLTALLYTELGYTVFGLFRMGAPAYIVESGEVWRLVTPIFLHGGLLHLVFNMVLLWFLGRQLEAQEPRAVLLILLLSFAVIPNFLQYLASGTQFGGMSGIVYAVLGYCWFWNRLNRLTTYVFPAAIMGLSIIFLLIGFIEWPSFLGLPSVGNAAHVGGLICGLVGAWLVTNIRKKWTI